MNRRQFLSGAASVAIAAKLAPATPAARPLLEFRNADGVAGSISTGGGFAIYSTSSDARLMGTEIRMADLAAFRQRIGALQEFVWRDRVGNA